jgi:hypothetical protein
MISCKSNSKELIVNSIYIYNFSNYPNMQNEITITSLAKDSKLNRLIRELSIKTIHIEKNFFYLITSPQQRTSGYKFVVKERSAERIICLEKPKSTDSVLMVLSYPMAIIETSSELKIKEPISFCSQDS